MRPVCYYILLLSYHLEASKTFLYTYELYRVSAKGKFHLFTCIKNGHKEKLNWIELKWIELQKLNTRWLTGTSHITTCFAGYKIAVSLYRYQFKRKLNWLLPLLISIGVFMFNAPESLSVFLIHVQWITIRSLSAKLLSCDSKTKTRF
jgi:hypothetical protein